MGTDMVRSMGNDIVNNNTVVTSTCTEGFVCLLRESAIRSCITCYCCYVFKVVEKIHIPGGYNRKVSETHASR